MSIITVGDIVAGIPFTRVQRFSKLRDYLKTSDLVIGNLESTLLKDVTLAKPPPSEFGPGWPLGGPGLASDLRHAGFDVLCRANNHAADFGVEGLVSTGNLLDEVGILHTGAGLDLGLASAPAIFCTKSGRVATIAIASSFAPLTRATIGAGRVPGRPGINGLRTRRQLRIGSDDFLLLQRFRERLRIQTGADDLFEMDLLEGRPDWEFSYSLNAVDEASILSIIDVARREADVLVFSVHAHQPGNWSTVPADFLTRLAHLVVDRGVDLFVCHGPHRVRGIEIYKAKPIIYSLGNFIFQLQASGDHVDDLFEHYSQEIGAPLAQARGLWNTLMFAGVEWRQGICAETRLNSGVPTQVRITPIEIGSGDDDGVPAIAPSPVSATILKNLQNLSSPFGTSIRVEGDTGVIEL